MSDAEPPEASSGQVANRPRHERGRMALFRRWEAVGLEESHAMDDVVLPESSAEFMARFDLDLLNEASFAEVVFSHKGTDGFSLVRAVFEPNFLLPGHSHDADCLYYVVTGEVRLGSQLIGAGEGFFVPAGHRYAYQVGPEGVEVLEFRHATTFNIVFPDGEDRWAEVFDVIAANRDAWSERRRRRTDWSEK